MKKTLLIVLIMTVGIGLFICNDKEKTPAKNVQEKIKDADFLSLLQYN